MKKRAILLWVWCVVDDAIALTPCFGLIWFRFECKSNGSLNFELLSYDWCKFRHIQRAYVYSLPGVLLQLKFASQLFQLQWKVFEIFYSVWIAIWLPTISHFDSFTNTPMLAPNYQPSQLQDIFHTKFQCQICIEMYDNFQFPAKNTHEILCISVNLK